MKKVSLEEKEIFNPEEAITFYGLSRRRFYRFLGQDKELPFLAKYKKRKLILRQEFETFLKQRPELKDHLRNRPRQVLTERR